MTILEQLASHAQDRVQTDLIKVSRKDMRELAYHTSQFSFAEFAFEKAIQQAELGFICECKKASPSKGVIVSAFNPLQIAKEYDQAGADCISVLTEPKWFLGSDHYLTEIAKEVKRPCLRKDFVVDEYQIYQAKVLGASAVLLICSILTKETLQQYLKICDRLGLSALVEIHDETEAMMAVASGARMIGVNNRNLKDFTINTDNSRRLREFIPEHILFVSESGVKDAGDIQKVREMGANAVLIGETLMRATDKKSKLAELRGVR